MYWTLCRRYTGYVAEREDARRAFRRLNPRRRGRRAILFPPGIPEALPLQEWLQEEVLQAIADGNIENIEKDVISLLTPPSLLATKYRSMWAFGNHFCVTSVEREMKTSDSWVVARFSHPCQSGPGNQNPVVAELEYVGTVEEIVELKYGGLSLVVFICAWVRANYHGQNATVKKDKWCFTLATFKSIVPFGRESFAFPMHCEQVFYVDARGDPGWKIVLRKEVRGKRIHEDVGAAKARTLFSIGNDMDHEGLQRAEANPGDNWAPLPTRRNI